MYINRTNPDPYFLACPIYILRYSKTIYSKYMDVISCMSILDHAWFTAATALLHTCSYDRFMNIHREEYGHRGGRSFSPKVR